MIITVVGAGGKTTVCLTLGSELARRGCTVLFTTTTHIRRPDGIPVYTGGASGVTPLAPLTAAVREQTAQGKLQGFLPQEIDEMECKGAFGAIVVEGDGSRGLPVKAPADWEPVYPAQTGLAVGVIGLDCLGKPVSGDFVHRPHLFCSATGAHLGDAITNGHLLALIQSPMGLFRRTPPEAQRIVLLNKADLPGVREQAAMLVRQASIPVLFTSRQENWTDGFISRFHLAGKRTEQ